MARVFLGPEWRPNEIGVMVNHPPFRFIREQFAGTRIRLAQPYSYISLDDAQLGVAPPADRATAPGNPAANYETLPPNFVGIVKRVMQAYVGEEKLTVDLVAGACDMGKRSLQRRLMAQGTHYSELLDQVGFDVATQMLRDGNKSVTDISELLGYSDATHFSRAFRRLAGVAPQRYRQQFSR